MAINLPRILKVVLLIMLSGLLYYQIFYGKGLEAILVSWKSQKYTWNLYYLGVCILLMPINWYLESVKWQILMAPHIRISLFRAFKTVLAGIALGIVTPARMGEYGGRLLISNPNHKTEVISATLLGSIAQNLCNIMGGLIFSYFFLKMIFGVTYADDITFILVISFQIIFFIFIFYNLPKVSNLLERILGSGFFQKYGNTLKKLDRYNNATLNGVLVISVIRYLVYFCQYLCIMYFLDVNVSFINLCACISSIYLIQTGIPLPAFLSVLARGELAISVWSGPGVAETTALMATFVLWFINLIIPAFVGLVILMDFDVKKYFKNNT